jgi:hypothetical protein
MRIIELAKEHRVRPQVIYNIIRDFEALGRIEINRTNRRLVLDGETVDIIRKELEERGYYGRTKEHA